MVRAAVSGVWRGVLMAGLLGLPAAVWADDGFVEIFNGQDLTGWIAEGMFDYGKENAEKPIWIVDDGNLVCKGRRWGFLRYDKELTDFVVHLQFRTSKGCNSGLGIRGSKFTGWTTSPSRSGYEIQILDDAGKKPNEHSSGALYRYVAAKQNAIKPAGEWNDIEIECRGPKIRITLNDVVIQDVDQSQIDAIKKKPLKGYFSVQDHGRHVEFRNIRLKELKP